MVEIVGYLCAVGAALAFWRGGTAVSAKARGLRLATGMGLGVGLMGAAIALLEPSSPTPLALAPLAGLASLSISLAFAENSDDLTGDIHGSR